ncbi:MAG: hypothetical protein AB1730_20815 [Myxococcota bacterium]|jgi:isoquinoline 1-oxidoreductase beta subunit
MKLTMTAEYADPNEHFRRNKVWGSMSTGGSQGVRASNQYVREAGAAAREMLRAAAAAKWKVPASECTTAKGVITHEASRRTLRSGEVATQAAKQAVAAPSILAPMGWMKDGEVDRTAVSALADHPYTVPHARVKWSRRDTPRAGA